MRFANYLIQKGHPVTEISKNSKRENTLVFLFDWDEDLQASMEEYFKLIKEEKKRNRLKNRNIDNA